MTFSLVARDPETGQLAVAVSSSSPTVGSRCAFARGKVGAVTTQKLTLPDIGPQVLDALEQGLTAQEALDKVIGNTSSPEKRQVTVIDAKGNKAIWLGEENVSGQAESVNVASAGNFLAHVGVPKAMVDGFERSTGETLGDRILDGLQAGFDAGGEGNPVRSAGLLVVEEDRFPLTDIRVDWDLNPIEGVKKIYDIWKPQMYEYRVRAVDPYQAPKFYPPEEEEGLWN